MAASGTTTIDFGAFPGSADATATVSGQTTIAADSEAEAWLWPAATADHTLDEHMVEAIKVFAVTVVAGSGFTIRAFCTTEFGESTLLYGLWSVAWAWA